MPHKKVENSYSKMGESFSNVAKALGDLQNANITVRGDVTSKGVRPKPILKGILGMTDKELDDYIASLMKKEK